MFSKLYVVAAMHLLPASIISIYYHLPNSCLCFSQLRMGPACRSSQLDLTAHLLQRVKIFHFPQLWSLPLMLFFPNYVQADEKLSSEVLSWFHSVLFANKQKGRQLCLCLHGNHDFVGVKHPSTDIQHTLGPTAFEEHYLGCLDQAFSSWKCQDLTKWPNAVPFCVHPVQKWHPKVAFLYPAL